MFTNLKTQYFKIQLSPKSIYKLNATSIKIPEGFLNRINEFILKFYRNRKSPK